MNGAGSGRSTTIGVAAITSAGTVPSTTGAMNMRAARGPAAIAGPAAISAPMRMRRAALSAHAISTVAATAIQTDGMSRDETAILEMVASTGGNSTTANATEREDPTPATVAID